MISASLILLRRIHKHLQEFGRSGYCGDVLCIKMACAGIEEGIIRLERYPGDTAKFVDFKSLEYNRLDRDGETSNAFIALRQAFLSRMLDVAKRGSAAPETLTPSEVDQLAFALEACLALQID